MVVNLFIVFNKIETKKKGNMAAMKAAMKKDFFRYCGKQYILYGTRNYYQQ